MAVTVLPPIRVSWGGGWELCRNHPLLVLRENSYLTEGRHCSVGGVLKAPEKARLQAWRTLLPIMSFSWFSAMHGVLRGSGDGGEEGSPPSTCLLRVPLSAPPSAQPSCPGTQAWGSRRWAILGLWGERLSPLPEKGAASGAAHFHLL